MVVTAVCFLLYLQAGDIQGLLTNRTVGASLYGATDAERQTVIIGKFIHYGLLLGLPWLVHGGEAAIQGTIAYSIAQSIVLAATFAVSHNVPESKPLDAGPTADLLDTNIAERDWGAQQILTSANWGGVIGNFMTGGLNLQIEHHLFPAISFMHYPAIAAIVEDEAKKRGIPYNHYKTLPEILVRFQQYMREVGVADQVPAREEVNAQLAKL
jgi:fatty acid desaturase (delta-4 desaturase)